MAQETIGGYIDRLMRRAEVSFAMLEEQLKAKNLKIHQNTIREIVSGKQSPKPATLRKLAGVLRGADYETMMRLAGHLPGLPADADQRFSPEVQDLAARLDGLSDKKRGKLLPLVEQILEVFDEEEETDQEEGGPVDAS